MKARGPINQSGFSLVNMMVGLGIGVVVMAAFVSAIQVMNRAKQTADVKLVASDFIDQIQANAIKPDSCEKSLGGNQILPASGGNPALETPLNFNGFSQGSELVKGVVIKTLKIKPTKPPLVSPGKQAEVRFSMPARIQVEIENRNVTPPMKLRGRFIPIQLVVDGANRIVNCGKIDTQAQVCAQLGGVWDLNAPEGLQCMPADKCLYGGSYSDAPDAGADANGAPNPGFINTFTGGKSCPNAFASQATGTVQVARKASKYKVVYDTYTNYTCVRCFAAVKNQAGIAPTTQNLDGTGEGEADAYGTEGSMSTDTFNIGNICSQLGIGC